MKGIHPLSLSELSIDKRKEYIYLLELKITTLENKELLLNLNNKDTSICLKEINQLKDSVLCLKYGLSCRYDIRDTPTGLHLLNDVCFELLPHLQKQIYAYLKALDNICLFYDNNSDFYDFDKDALRLYFYPFICSTGCINYEGVDYANPINFLIYTLINDRFSNLKTFITNDLNSPNVFSNLVPNYHESNGDFLKDYLFSNSVTTYNRLKVIEYADFGDTLDTFMEHVISIFKADNLVDEEGYLALFFKIDVESFREFTSIPLTFNY